MTQAMSPTEPARSPGSTLPPATAVRLVAERELRTRIVSKAFLGGLAFTVILVVLGFVFGAAVGDDDPTRIGVVGSGQERSIETLEAFAELEDRDIEIEAFDTVADAELAITEGDIDAAVVDGTTFVIERADPGLLGFVSAAWQQAGLLDGLASAGLSDTEIGQALAAAEPLEVRELDPDDEREARDGIAFVSVIILFISVQIAGAYILMGVLEEKTSKVVELILSSISARDLLIGKVLGIGIIGLIQVLVLLGSIVVCAQVVGSDVVPSITAGMVVAGLAWFLVGYLFYGALFASGAALVTRQEDAQSALAPITIVIMGAYFASLYVAGDPDSQAARILSLLPPIAPFAMPGRIAIGGVPAWEVALAFGLAVVSVIGVLALAGKIYVRSVMHTGKTLGWREAWKLES